MKDIIKEIIIKNVILIVLFILSYPIISDYLMNSNLPQDKASAGDVLVAISIIAVIACFGCFAFTYEKVNNKKANQRYLAHITTGLLTLIIGISLIFTSILIIFIMGHFFLVDMMLVALYLACVGYDFWDGMR
ncbi:hypothetical protein KKF81_05940 [Candidatus Micrarchaeota archaeon]|nr:hypothetical protein [Candidatus Micrarchaeota archaeon]MBU1166469.1 hypothetical protein [Candidatus Micrarchaeota archaeon]MBU1886175.1 hypothetical protein [Candidatus Micrarchaeota archaeon]